MEKSCVILASADNLLHDVERLKKAGGWPDIVIAVNQAPLWYLDRIDFWVTLHVDEFETWAKKRKELGGNTDYQVVSRPRENQPAFVDLESDHLDGSSGLLAVIFARRKIQMERITACGMPMEVRPHMGSNTPWSAALKFRQDWMPVIDELRPFFRSMSGWTRLVFGEPSAAWLRGEPEPGPALTGGRSNTFRSAYEGQVVQCQAVRHGGKVRCIRPAHGPGSPHSDRYGKQWWDRGRFGPVEEPREQPTTQQPAEPAGADEAAAAAEATDVDAPEAGTGEGGAAGSGDGAGDEPDVPIPAGGVEDVLRGDAGDG